MIVSGEKRKWALRRSGVRGELAGLARAAHFAGQAFGHEDLVALPARRLAPLSPARMVWWLVAIAALLGLAVLAFGGGSVEAPR